MTGVVVCPQPRIAEAGAQVLETGGNAFDAAIATAFLQMIVDPFMCGIGGFASIQAWAPTSGRHQIIDGNLQVGSRAYPEMWAKDYQGRAPFSGSSIFSDYRSEIGYSSICVPGTMAALGTLHRQYCTQPWADLLQPAIRIAREGVQATSGTRDFLAGRPSPGSPDGLTRLNASEACARIYLHPDGSLFDVGEVIRNPDYANVLEILAKKGPDEFYQGELSQTIGQDLEKNGALVTMQDLERYRPQIRKPAATTYRGYKVFSNCPPAGGPMLLEALNILECFGLSHMEHNSAEHLTLVADTLRLVFQDRRLYYEGPEATETTEEEALLTKEHAQHLARNRRTTGDTPETGRGSSHTTQLVVVDQEGNIAAITHSLAAFSGVITPGLGFIYNDGMNTFDPIPGRLNSIGPGKFRLYNVMPTIVFQGDEPRLALGAPGGQAILSGCFQAISNVLDFGMTAVEAVYAPRIHAEGWTVWGEARIRTETCDALTKQGYTVERQPFSFSPRLAQVQLVRLLPDGRLDGGSDPRGGGEASATPEARRSNC
ncbi:gamma-glutamyltransferase family protein [Chloroflexota bacterium]